MWAVENSQGEESAESKGLFLLSQGRERVRCEDRNAPAPALRGGAVSFSRVMGWL